MTNIFDFLFKFYQTLPTTPKIIFIIIVCLVILAIGFKYGATAIKTISTIIKNKRKETHRMLEQLKTHPLFNQINHWNYKIEHFNFGDVERNKIYRSILRIKNDVVKEKSQELINIPVEDLEKDVFSQKVLENLDDIITIYNRKIKEKFGDKLYDFIMNGERGYNQWNDTTVIYNREMCTAICDSDFYGDNLEKLYSILTVYQTATDAALVNVERTFRGFNGNLDALIKTSKKNGTWLL